MDESYTGRWIVRLDGNNMIIDHRKRDKNQNADRLSKKTEFYKTQEQKETDRPEIKDGFSYIHNETYDNLPLTRWLDKSGKPKEDHPELPAEHETKEILKRKTRMPMGMMLKSKIERETLKAKGYDPDEVQTGRLTIGEGLRRLPEKLADDKPVARNNDRDKPEVTILKRGEKAQGDDSTIRQPDGKEVVRTLVEKIPEDILRQTTLRKKKMTFREEVEHLGPEFGDWSKSERDIEVENLSGESDEWEDDSEKSGDDQDSLCMILAEEKMRHHDRELQTDSSAGMYNLEQQDEYGGEELEKLGVSRKPFRELSCISNVRTNLKPDDDREVLRKIVCIKLKDDIHSLGELNGQMMVLK